MANKNVDLTGQQFGRLTVLSKVASRKSEGNRTRGRYLCQCTCLSLCFVTTSDLTSGNTTSCGCKKREEKHVVHGHSAGGKRTSEWHIYYAMLSRCYKPTNKGYANYGGRGITVCKRWREGNKTKSGFQCFIADMGRRPVDTSLERINNNGNYTPYNCKWATIYEQKQNTRRVLRTKYGCVAEVARTFAVPYDKLRRQFKALRDIDAAISVCRGQ